MNHLEHINGTADETELKVKFSGKYYTHHFIAKNSIQNLLGILKKEKRFKTQYSICDPFAGDGRLVIWFLEMWSATGLPSVKWSINLWDIELKGVEQAKREIEKLNVDIEEINIINQDSFKYALEKEHRFDFIVTNPPWEMIKPDRRELKNLSESEKRNIF